VDGVFGLATKMAYGSSGMTCIKYLLFLFNFIFWVSGIGIVVAGAIIQIRYSTYINFLGDSFLSAPILLIAIGCIIAVMGFFGCCGAIRENYCMSMTFAVLLGLIFILELAAGIAGYILRSELEQVIRVHALDGMSHYNMTGSTGVTEAWDQMQETLKCCGISNYTDWRNNTWFEHTNNVPVSCCLFDGCDVSIRDKPFDVAAENIFIDACADRLRDWASEKMGIIIGIACAIAAVQTCHTHMTLRMQNRKLAQIT